jgi:hypothetical protein
MPGPKTASPRYRPDRQQHLVFVRALEQVPAGLGAHGSEDRIIFLETY